ncbi:LysR substrate-binding domain-containing protein [Rhodococcus sp. G-MC3]|uniref:LysR substrate-binding domain-containing protein n=1 Tax=Rhodococcus sp. G-MC3 TaxID=3046209 RepID=UPI0024BA4A59|nr:LysR substrate-binding domain-containing protein [Rhodococcus sp. G-MC3]MDJ0393651.1 LysR substrate-binding domain-containing protein [Rhodococcus sp. G-MC3]
MDESVAHLLAAFDAVATTGHVTRASEMLDVPQSSVSRRVKALERILGVELVHPVGRGVALTPSGREFHARTHAAVRMLDEAASAVRSDADPDGGLVRFGFPLTLGSRMISSLLTKFHQEAPRVRVHLVQAHGEALVDMLRDGRLDLAVMIPPVDDLATTILGSQRILLHVPRSHRLADYRGEVDVVDLAGEAFVASPKSFHLRTILDDWCSAAGFVPRVPFEINEIDTIRALVGDGLGIALLPAGDSPNNTVVTVSLSGDRTREVGLATSRYRPTAAVTRFRQRALEQRWAFN